MKECITVISILIFGAALLMCLCLSDVPMSRTYTNSVILHSAEEVPAALSNAVNKVQEKGFTLIKVKTSHNVFTGSYTVEVGGIEPEQILNLDK